MAKLTPKQLSVALWQATKDKKGDDLSIIIKNFSALLARKRMLKKTGLIIENFVKYSKQQQGVEFLEVISARPLSEKTIESVKKLFGDKVELKTKINSSLIGGIIIKTQDKIMDASLKTQLNKFEQSLV